MGTTETMKNCARPFPPDGLVSVEGLLAPDRFEPAPDFARWIRETYLEEGGAFFFDTHSRLLNAQIGVLWTTAPYWRRGRQVLAQAEMPGRSKSTWTARRNLSQLHHWFGFVPDFLLTFDAIYADGADDATFAALVDHELCHCAQAEDEFGNPKFNRETGQPSWKLRGHDVEEFVSVVQRFGIHAAGEAAVDLVIAASQRPAIAAAKVAQGCGTCLLRAA